MSSPIRFAGQIAVYAAVMAMLGYFADSPAYRHFPAGQALVKIALTHGGQSKEGCRVPTSEELDKLPPNMRRKLICGRERVPVTVELEIDGEVILARTLEPSGLRSDGPSGLYESFPVEVGVHTLIARLRDSGRTQGFDYETSGEVALRPGALFIVQFKAEAGGFQFR